MGCGLLLLLVILQSICSGYALYFEDGFDHHYTYSSQSDILGLHNVTTIIKFRVRSVNESSAGQALHMLIVDSVVQKTEQESYVIDNAMHWQFNRTFFFTVGLDGQVTFVHFHPEEKDEVLTMKKVLASTLSLKVKVEEGKSWRFTSHEEDHAGHLEHEYEVTRHTDGTTYIRKHESSEDVHRLHNKTVHLDLQGTPVHVEAIDNITLRHSPSKVASKSMDGFYNIEDKQSGEFPKISSVSRSRVTMTTKRRHNEPSSHSVNNLRNDTLSVKQKPPVKVPLKEIEKDIKRHLACIHSIENKYDRNRTECVHNLRTAIYSLVRNDFIQLGTDALTRQCDPNDLLCVDERNLFIDILAHEGSTEAQLLVLEHVMRNPNVTENDLRRCLFHSIAIASPELELVRHIEQLCFTQDVDPGDTPTLSKTQKRACLSLGALAKSLQDKNITESDRIVERIENWLDHHNETKSSEIVKPRARRSVSQLDSSARKHIETKMLLLHCLGNAGKQRSLKHIRSYMEPNVGVTAWRRAAINSLRHFSCNESAHALLKSAVEDEDYIVRMAAVDALKNHPKSTHLTTEHENVVLSKNYSYPVVARVRRGIIDILVEDGIRIKLEPPGIGWDKNIGSDDIGASFGLHIRNLLDLKLGILSGHFIIDVHNEAYAEAHVGLVNFQIDIIRARVCYKGHVEYDMNVLKDFGINSLADLVKIYDKIIGKVVTPIVDLITSIKQVLNMFKGEGLEKILNSLIEMVKSLPVILGDVGKRMLEFMKEVFSVNGPPIVEEIKTIVYEMKAFIDGVQQDILKFYNDIVDAVTIVLPYVGKRIVDAVGMIVKAVKDIKDNPMRSITEMSRAVTNILKMALVMGVEVKEKVMYVCKFFQGQTTQWMDMAKEIPSLLMRLQNAFKRLAEVATEKGSNRLSDMKSPFSDGVRGKGFSVQHLQQNLITKWEHVEAPLKPLKDIVLPFISVIKNVADLVQNLKSTYKELKETIERSKSLVQKVFGPKFNSKFPTGRRPAKGGCKAGVWPTVNESNDRYETTGVDLELGVGQSVHMPVNGIVHVKDESKVVIQPTDPEFVANEIVIENVAPEYKYHEKEVRSGTKIGKAKKVRKCVPNSIHVSVRNTQANEVDDANYDYIDPGPFLDRLFPIPKWIEDCNDFLFSVLNVTFDSGEATESDPQKKTEPIERSVESRAKGLDKMFAEEDPKYRPDDPALYDQTSFADSLNKSLAKSAQKFIDLFSTALFDKNGPKVPNILDILNINNKDVRWILGMLVPGSKKETDIKDVLNGLLDKMTSRPEGNLATVSLEHAKTLLNQYGLKPVLKGGAPSNVADTLLSIPGKACPNFKGTVASGFGHVCTPEKCCHGITCSVPVTVGEETEHLSVNVVVNQENYVDATVMNKRIQFHANNIEDEYDLEVKVFGMKLLFVVSGRTVHGVVILTIELKLCKETFLACLEPIDLFHEIKFDRRNCRQARDTLSDKKLEMDIYSYSWPTLMSQLAEYGLLEKNVVTVVESVRETVVMALMTDTIDKLENNDKEFKDKTDFCLDANIPVPPLDIPIFSYKQIFFAGPVPLSLEFGAGAALGVGIGLKFCVLSMAAGITVTPWVGGKVWGAAAIDLFVLRGGIKLVGYLMETKFPISVDLVFSKYPIDVSSKMDLVLIPVKLELSAFVEAYIPFIKIHKVFYEGSIWKYTAPSIKFNIFTIKTRDDDRSPPRVMPATINERKKRSGIEGCIVKQIVGRPYYDPAFSLEMYAQDEASEVKIWYAIGTHRGGTNIVEWTNMGGNSLMVPSKLPGGIPLYWSVKANNSQGLEAVSQCKLDTYDSTLPDGRVEHSYTFSSHPHKIIASVVAFEDSPLVEVHYKAVGFSPGKFGSQFVDWEVLRLDHSSTRNGVSGALRHFTIPREGKLVAWVLKSEKSPSPEMCAQLCIDYGSNCISFDYELHSQTCDVHDVVQGANAYLRISGTYSNYERLGSGYTTAIEYDNLLLTHGTMYFVNAKVKNVLGYDGYLTGEGTMVDFTPPEPGLIKNVRSDTLRADKCSAAITQQCIDVTWKENHRIIVDGPGSATVFNGHQPLRDELYTLTNHYVTANWNAFHDDESGIFGYTWAVGKTVCGKDVLPFIDPYTHLSSRKFWTDSGFRKGIHLADGPYYVTVQALNGAELGGSLVTTVCHSLPFYVDTTPPIFSGVTDIIYDEDFDLIAIYYNATDDLSKIAFAEFGLGKTRYDVQLRRYSLHASMDRDDPFVAVEDLGLQEGIPAWIRIRVTNSVELFTSGHGHDPVMIDRSPPIAGHVLDGDRLRRDRAYQSEDFKICAQWRDFFDPQSGIDVFIWGVGSKAGLDDIVDFHNLTRYDKSSCALVQLQHNHTYFSSVFAYNNALNSKSANSTSDGVLVDITPPIAGVVLDGKQGAVELAFSSETVSKFANWNGYYDPESGIDHYKLDVLINNEHIKTFDVGQEVIFEDHTISMEHLDKVHFKVHGVNGAELLNDSRSDGFLVDLTKPVLIGISDSVDGVLYQSNNTAMNLMWEFIDPESGIREYRTVIYESMHGVKHKFRPTYGPYNITVPQSPDFTKITSEPNDLTLKNGAHYSLQVTGVNRALLATSHETAGVTIDTTPPQAPKVHIGLWKDEEDLDEDGNVIHVNQNGIRVSWLARDPESGIKHYMVAVSKTNAQEFEKAFTELNDETTAFIQNVNFEITEISGTFYQVYVKAINGAGLVSKEGKSKPIIVQRANVPGIVFDGRNLFEDDDYTFDHSSIAASFYGFKSDICSIVGYDWTVGTREYGTDIQTFTSYGLTMLNETHGQCQINIELLEGTMYYLTVRAMTACQEEYIVSSSDGIMLDSKPPEVMYEVVNETDTVTVNSVMFQTDIGTLSLNSNVTDENYIASVQYALESLPLHTDNQSFTGDFSDLTSGISLEPGATVFITAKVSDKAGNVNFTSSLAIVADSTSPYILNLECSKYLSVRQSLLACEWETVDERESVIDSIKISIGSTDDSVDNVYSVIVPRKFRSFTKDFYKYIDSNTNVTSLYINVDVKNVVGLIKNYGRHVVIDRTAPIVERLDVITNVGKEHVKTQKKCQLSRTHVELTLFGAVDDESTIDEKRFEVSLGSKPYQTNILGYKPVVMRPDGVIYINGFNLRDREVYFATLRIYNKAGLRTEVASDSVVISEFPTLRVYDGDQEEDIDYQSKLNLILGRWEYSDNCPIEQASWSVSDLSGNILFDYQAIPSASKNFYNDEVSLENGMKYIVTVRTVDFLGRSKTSQSDGVSVRIQPPLPGLVRDGLFEDLNYQSSTSELSANWDSFGDDSKDPTQSINHYEVAIGNDRRYTNTRTNVHYFVNVGLNTSYTFENLNLTAKLIRYYITVRSYSMTGGYIENYSNGIRVGYNDDIQAGTIAVRKYQSSTTYVEVSWSGFRSDIDIIDYTIGLSSQDAFITNDTSKCSMFFENKTAYDIYPLHSVGVNEYYNISGLNLQHRDVLHATVIAKDESGMCVGITSDNVLVDTTPPSTGLLFINDIQSTTVIYARSSTEIHVTWKNFSDTESGILSTKVSLYQCETCNTRNVNTHEKCFDIGSNIVKNDDKSSFYEIKLDAQHVYFIVLEFVNGAELVTLQESLPILVDTSNPFVGEVKIANDWYSTSAFQYSTSELHGFMAVATNFINYICPTQIRFFPQSREPNFHPCSDEFNTDYVVVNSSGAYLGLGYNADLSEIIKSGIMFEAINLQTGNYSFTTRVARGYKTITTVALLTELVAVPFVFKEKPIEEGFDYSRFDSITPLGAHQNNDSGSENTTTVAPTKVKKNRSLTHNNNTDSETHTNFDTDSYGIGIHFLGYKIAENENWHHIFWARNKFTSIEEWFQLPFDPTSEEHNYTILVNKNTEYLETTLDITLIVDNEEFVNIAGIKFSKDMKITALTWNEDEYKPLINDIYHPFYTDAVVKIIDIPDENDKPCRHGRGFYDEESGIKSIQVGVSDSKTNLGNVLPFFEYKSFCYPCKEPCESLCEQPCSGETLSLGFNLIPIDVYGLSMNNSNKDDSCQNITNNIECNETAFFLNVKVVNYAGDESVTYSNAIQLDLTPPYCEYVKCLDPKYSDTEPTQHLGSNSTIGAYWNCTEDTSQIQHYIVRVLSSNGVEIMQGNNVGLTSKVTLELGEGSFEDGNVYTVEIAAVNTAGLLTNKSCSVHVSLYPPDVSGLSTEMLYITNTDQSLILTERDTPYFSSSQKTIGLEWQGGNTDIEYYEWQIGSNDYNKDIFPSVTVGNTASGSSAIVNGKLELNKKAINKSVAEFRNVSGMTLEELENFTSISEHEKAFFLMEPGRCLHQSLYAIGYSHLRSIINRSTICIKREGDVFLSGTRAIDTIKKLVVSKPNFSDAWLESMTNDPGIVVDAELTAGGLGLGTLTHEDIDNNYGSAATTDFVPFIVNPKYTINRTSRLLHNRIQQMCNLSFYFSPSPLVEFEHIIFNVTLPAGCRQEFGYQPALIYWDHENDYWVHIDEGCREYLTSEVNSGIYTSEVCKRSTKKSTIMVPNILTSPRMIILARISGYFLNNPPRIVTDVLYLTEDIAEELVIQSVDLENDSLVYKVLQFPANLDCDVVNGTNILKCIPQKDFYGNDTIKIRVIETDIPENTIPLIAEKLIDLIVEAKPDKTDRYYIDVNKTLHYELRPSMVREFIVEANRSSTFFAGTILLADVDGDEIFTVKSKFTALAGATFKLTAVDTSLISVANETSKLYRSLSAYDIHLMYSSKLNGRISLNLIAQTNDGMFTPSFTAELYILENPCVHGHCSDGTLTNTECDNIRRSISFSHYTCVCDPGYEGEWCQMELNECQTADCALLFDCQDLINGYTCNINIPKLMSILLSSIIAVVAILLIYKRARRLKHYMVKSEFSLNMGYLDEFNAAGKYTSKSNANDRHKTSRSPDLKSASIIKKSTPTQDWHNRIEDDLNIDDKKYGEEMTLTLFHDGKEYSPQNLKPGIDTNAESSSNEMPEPTTELETTLTCQFQPPEVPVVLVNTCNRSASIGDEPDRFEHIQMDSQV